MNDTDQAVPGTKPDRLMRLFEVTYKCPICRHHHIMEMYIAAETTDLDELTHKAKNLTNDPDEMIPRFIRAATRIHTKAGEIGYFGQTSQDPNWLQTYTVSIEMDRRGRIHLRRVRPHPAHHRRPQSPLGLRPRNPPEDRRLRLRRQRPQLVVPA